MEKAKTETISIVAFLAFVVVAILIALLYKAGAFSRLSSGDRIIDIDTKQEVNEEVSLDPEIAENPEISYPGYETLTFKAGRKKQEVYLTNPEENTCYFRISLTLEDGTLVWQSGELMPGEAFEQIELISSLERGTYEGVTLKYESYSLKDGRQLNGFSLNVAIEAI